MPFCQTLLLIAKNFLFVFYLKGCFLQMDSNVSFKGVLYGKTGNHLTKGIIYCPHGDNKFVRFVNSIGENSTNIKEKNKSYLQF